MVSIAGVGMLAVSKCCCTSDSSLVHVYIIYIYGTCVLHAFFKVVRRFEPLKLKALYEFPVNLKYYCNSLFGIDLQLSESCHHPFSSTN